MNQKLILENWRKFLKEELTTTQPSVSTANVIGNSQQQEEEKIVSVTAAINSSIETALKSQEEVIKTIPNKQAVKDAIKNLIDKIQLREEKKSKSGDRCTRIAKRKYDVWPSAYASGAVVRCRQGKIWKGVSENASDQEIDDALLLEEIELILEKDPKVGTGKKPKSSDRRLYTDENPKDTVSVKFSTVQDIKDTLSKESFKSKPHARQSQIINLIHQRTRSAHKNAKDPEVKARLKKSLDYAEERKETSKEKTKTLQKEQQIQLNEKCWKGYTQKGMKTMFGKKYPNCVKVTKESVDLEEANTLEEEWSEKYKSSIDCKNPKGFSQKAHCQGKKKNEDIDLGEVEIIEEAKKKAYKPNFSKEKEQGLHGWFARNDGKGWVNCRTGGPCGRDNADKGGKYPACRPTKAQCKSAGKGPLRKKKSSSPISWTKKKKD